MLAEARRSLVIAGPCAAESRMQVLDSARMAKERGVDYVRASLWKPRTKPGFDGVGMMGLEWLEEVAKMGVVPATEVMSPRHAEGVVDAISGKLGARVLVWIGSRNQNHEIQQGIGNAVRGDKNVKLLIKNQPWENEEHWKGIIDHAIHGGASPDQIILCHRGFAPGTDGLRNKPDFEMAMRVKKDTGMPMVIDPSHIGGDTEKVLEVLRQANDFKHDGLSFDGVMIEVHPNPENAQTDKNQQLTWEQFDKTQVVFQR